MNRALHEHLTLLVKNNVLFRQDLPPIFKLCTRLNLFQKLLPAFDVKGNYAATFHHRLQLIMIFIILDSIIINQIKRV